MLSHHQHSLVLIGGENFSEPLLLLCLCLPSRMAVIILTSVKSVQHTPAVTLKHTFSPGTDFVGIDWRCQKRERRHNFSCDEKCTRCPTISIFKSSTNFNNYVQ